MSNLEKLKGNKELIAVVSALLNKFPDVDLTTDSEYYPWKDGTVVIYANKVDEIAAKSVIRDTIEIKHSKLLFRFNTMDRGSLILKHILPLGVCVCA